MAEIHTVTHLDLTMCLREQEGDSELGEAGGSAQSLSVSDLLL